MAFSFSTVRIIGIVVLLVLMAAFGTLYYVSSAATVSTLKTVMYDYLPLYDRTLVVIKTAEEVFRLFDLYVYQPRLRSQDCIFLVDQLIGAVRSVSENAPGDVKQRHDALITVLAKLRAAMYQYFNEEKRNPGGTATIDTRMTVMKYEQEGEVLLRECFNDTDVLDDVANNGDHRRIFAVYREMETVFDRYCNQKVVYESELLAMITQLQTMCCKMLRPLVKDRSRELMNTAAQYVIIFKVAVREYFTNYNEDPSSGSTDEMRRAALLARGNMRESLQAILTQFRAESEREQSAAIRRLKQIQVLVCVGLVGGSVAAIMVVVLLSRFITRRITVLLRGTECFSRGDWTYRIPVDSRDQFSVLANAFNTMVEQLQQTSVSKDYFNNILTAMNDAMIMLSPERLISDVNRAACELLQYSRTELIGMPFCRIVGDGDDTPRGRETDASQSYERVFITKQGARVPVLCSEAIMTQLEAVGTVIILAKDVSALKKSEAETKQLQLELYQAQKLEAIGTLAAGIAHEINTPIQFIGDNARFMRDGVKGLFQVLDAYKDVVVKTGHAGEVQEIERMVEPEFLRKESVAALDQTMEGVARVAKIVNAMKSYAYADTEEKKESAINEAVDTTITLSQNEWKYVADIDRHLDPALPPVRCFLADIKQVVLNLIINAAHAIEPVRQRTGTKGRIVVMTRKKDENTVEIRVQDTGTGIRDDIKAKVFDPFFTTKGVGKGTGQGLALARRIVVEKHQGRIWFESAIGKGTTFIVELPIAGK